MNLCGTTTKYTEMHSINLVYVEFEILNLIAKLNFQKRKNMNNLFFSGFQAAIQTITKDSGMVNGTQRISVLIFVSDG